MYQALVLVHILAAMLWVGGLWFIVLVVVPATRQLPPAGRAALFAAVGRRFRVVGWIALGLLVLTGLGLAWYRGVFARLASGHYPGGTFDTLLLAKVLVVAFMLAASALHDFRLGPASARQPGQPDVRRPRRWAAWLPRLTALLALVVVALAVALTRGLP